MTNDLMTVDELSLKLKVPKSWVYSRTRESGSDAIPRVHVGKYLRFKWDEVEEWLRKRNKEN